MPVDPATIRPEATPEGASVSSDRSVEAPAPFHQNMRPVASVVMSEISRLIDDASARDGRAAAQLLPLVYDEWRKLASERMSAEAPGHTLTATALVHDASLRPIED
jgi:hypothetical protein